MRRWSFTWFRRRRRWCRLRRWTCRTSAAGALGRPRCCGGTKRGTFSARQFQINLWLVYFSEGIQFKSYLGFNIDPNETMTQKELNNLCLEVSFNQYGHSYYEKISLITVQRVNFRIFNYKSNQCNITKVFFNLEKISLSCSELDEAELSS